jgi:hypothetical protein
MDQQTPEPTSDGSDGSASDPEGSGNDNNSPMNDWEEFDEDAVYQRRHVDPEMRQWVLTNDCRRIISDTYFNNPACNQSIRGIFSGEVS